MGIRMEYVSSVGSVGNTLGREVVRMLTALPETEWVIGRWDVQLRDGYLVAGLFVHNAEQLDWPDDRPRVRPADIVNIALVE